MCGMRGMRGAPPYTAATEIGTTEEEHDTRRGCVCVCLSASFAHGEASFLELTSCPGLYPVPQTRTTLNGRPCSRPSPARHTRTHTRTCAPTTPTLSHTHTPRKGESTYMARHSLLADDLQEHDRVALVVLLRLADALGWQWQRTRMRVARGGVSLEYQGREVRLLVCVMMMGDNSWRERWPKSAGRGRKGGYIPCFRVSRSGDMHCSSTATNCCRVFPSMASMVAILRRGSVWSRGNIAFGDGADGWGYGRLGNANGANFRRIGRHRDTTVRMIAHKEHAAATLAESGAHERGERPKSYQRRQFKKMPF